MVKWCVKKVDIEFEADAEKAGSLVKLDKERA